MHVKRMVIFYGLKWWSRLPSPTTVFYEVGYRRHGSTVRKIPLEYGGGGYVWAQRFLTDGNPQLTITQYVCNSIHTAPRLGRL